MIYYGNELYHHGILGQKWGIRRFQNEDGTRTPAGKRRRAELEDLSEVSDADLQRKLNRTRNEVQYYQEKEKLEKIKNGDIEKLEKTGKSITDQALGVLKGSTKAMATVTGTLTAANTLKKTAAVAAVGAALVGIGNIVRISMTNPTAARYAGIIK